MIAASCGEPENALVVTVVGPHHRNKGVIVQCSVITRLAIKQIPLSILFLVAVRIEGNVILTVGVVNYWPRCLAASDDVNSIAWT